MLQRDDDLLRRALDSTGTGLVLTDPREHDNPVVYANRPFLEMTGYSAVEVLGRNCRFLQGPDTDPDAVSRLRDAIAGERPVSVLLRNYRKDGTPFWNEVHLSPVHDEDGTLVRFVGMQYDVSTYQDRLRLSARERGARETAEFLAEASPLLDASLDLRSTLDSLTRLAVPFLADACVVNEIRFEEVHRLAAGAADPEVQAIVRALPARYAVRADEALARVLESGRAEIVAGAGSPVFGPEGGQLRGDSMLVPLTARGRAIGAVLFVSFSGRRYSDGDLVVAEDLARRAALALDNARLYENLGSIARTLQEGLLPDRLPAHDGMDFAARYRPAGDGSMIGGDFYDVLPRPDGVDLVIGDVTGKGARAAALTGLVRHTVRTAARYEETPSRILDVVNRTLVAERGTSGRYCTVAFCRVAFNGTAHATLCCAGHPMPMVMRREGTVERVGRPGSVLGWVEDPKLLDVDFTLEGGESLVLYTDGVTEARTTGDAYGMAALEALLRAASGHDAADIAARVDRAAARAGRRRDDVAVLVTRVRPR